MLKTRHTSKAQQPIVGRCNPSQPQNKHKAEAADAEQINPKERRLRQRQRDRLRKEITTFLAAVGFLGLMMGLLLGLLGGIKMAAAGMVGIVVLAVACKYPRIAMWGFLIYVPLGGTITYAIGNSPLLQLAKDGLYIPALIGILQHCKRQRLPFLIPKQIILLSLSSCCCAA